MRKKQQQRQYTTEEIELALDGLIVEGRVEKFICSNGEVRYQLTEREREARELEQQHTFDADPQSSISVYRALLTTGRMCPTTEKFRLVAALKRAAAEAGAPPEFLNDLVKLHFLVQAKSEYPSGFLPMKSFQKKKRRS
jgi:hypothetical protein